MPPFGEPSHLRRPGDRPTGMSEEESTLLCRGIPVMNTNVKWGVVIGLVLGLASWALSACNVATYNGQTYDFSPLARSSGYHIDSNGYSWDIALCSPLSSGICGGSGGCQRNPSLGESWSLGSWSPVVSSSYPFQIYYGGGTDDKNCPHPRDMRAYLYCNAAATSAYIFQATEVSSCSYQFLVYTSLACPSSSASRTPTPSVSPTPSLTPTPTPAPVIPGAASLVPVGVMGGPLVAPIVAPFPMR